MVPVSRLWSALPSSKPTWETRGVRQSLAQGVPLQAHKGGVLQLGGHVPELVVPQVQSGKQWEAGQASGH